LRTESGAQIGELVGALNVGLKDGMDDGCKVVDSNGLSVGFFVGNRVRGDRVGNFVGTIDGIE
jgi:uncharacterized protein YcfJ